MRAFTTPCTSFIRCAPCGLRQGAPLHRPPTHSASRPYYVRASAASQEPVIETAVETSASSLNGAAPVAAPADEVLSSVAQFLEGELRTLFTTGGGLTVERYSDDMLFEDPLFRFNNLTGYRFNVSALRTLFDVDFTLHSIKPSDKPNELLARWTMRNFFKLAPWRPEVAFTGCSYYGVDPVTGKITYQRDTWDAVDNNTFPSLEAAAYVAGLMSRVQLTPDLETPQYVILRKTREYEVRQYDPYVVAQTSMPQGEGPAGGSGFNELASYIFGGNASNTQMEMTTPVLTTAEPGQGSRMAFVVGQEFASDPAALPRANDASVSTHIEEGGIVAAASLSGLPFEWEAAAAERALRGALTLDGLSPDAGWKLARYNDPFTPPPLRRNEVLIRLKGFTLQ